MSTANTGIKRATKLIIHRLNDGVDIAGYPHIFDMRDLIPDTDYLAATTDELKELTGEEYVLRRDALIDYVNGQLGYTASNENSTLTDTEMCPL